jgi:hypothetical protein
MDACKQREAHSKTAGCKVDSCPTRPVNPEFVETAVTWYAASFVCCDPIGSQRQHHRLYERTLCDPLNGNSNLSKALPYQVDALFEDLTGTSQIGTA